MEAFNCITDNKTHQIVDYVQSQTQSSMYLHLAYHLYYYIHKSDKRRKPQTVTNVSVKADSNFRFGELRGCISDQTKEKAGTLS